MALTFYFERPAALLALAVLPPLWLLWARASRLVQHVTTLLSDEGGRAQRAARPVNLLGGLSRLCALAALIVGLAGPSAFRPDSLALDAVPLVFVLDVSASMAAADVRPDRLAAARNAVTDLCSLVPGVWTALIAVAQDAVVVCPLTADRDAFLALLSQVRADWTSAGGTNLIEGIRKARELIATYAGTGVVVLLSDGEDHGEPPDPPIQDMSRAGILTHTVVVGSTEGVVLENLPPPAVETVVTKAQPRQMAHWAALGGGHAWTIAPNAEVLPARAAELIPRITVRTAAQALGAVTSLAPAFYLLAAALLLASRFLAY